MRELDVDQYLAYYADEDMPREIITPEEADRQADIRMKEIIKQIDEEYAAKPRREKDEDISTRDAKIIKYVQRLMKAKEFVYVPETVQEEVNSFMKEHGWCIVQKEKYTFAMPPA